VRYLATILVLVAACSGGGGGAKASTPAARYRGATLVPPLPQPDFTLKTTDGKPFHYKEETKGYVSLLFFGYTHCPDVCPVHMANLASVLDRLPPGTAGSIKVIFVTVDPARDKPKELRKWLDKFRPSFIGLWGSLDEVTAAARKFGMPGTEIEKLPDGGYAVGHGAAVIAAVGDSVRVLYPFGIRQADWMEDLPHLVDAIPREHKAD
jgi:protein SCO1/2